MTARHRSALALLAVGLAWAVATFRDAAYLRFGDWDQYLTFFEVQRRSLLEYGSFPLWNPWLLGGIPGHAHPQFNCLSPFLWPILVLGTVPGAAVFFALHAFTGLTGCYLLARFLRYGRAESLLCGVVFLFAFAPFVAGGVVNRVNGSLAPWLVLLLLRTFERPRWVLALALAVLLLVLEGGFYALVGAGLMLGLLCLLPRRPLPVARAAALLALGLVLGCGLGLVRLLPTADLYLDYPRQSGFYEARAMVQPEALPTTAAAVASLLTAPAVGRRDVLFDQPIFVGVDLGIPLLALFLLGVVYVRRPALWLLLLVFLLLVLGNASALNLWAILSRVPGLWSLNLPMSLLFFLFVPLGLILAGALGATTRRLFARPGTRQRVALAAVLLFGVAPLLAQSWSLLSRHPRPPLPPAAAADAPFRTVRGQRSAMLPSVRRNEGVLDAYEEVISQRFQPAAVAAGGAGDRGEWFFAGEGTVESARFAPGRLEFQVRCPRPDRLIVNQNHLPGWRADRDGRALPVSSAAGRLAVEVPAGQGTLTLRYAPRSFAVGALGSLCFAAFSLWLLRRPRWLERLAVPIDPARLLGPPD